MSKSTENETSRQFQIPLVVSVKHKKGIKAPSNALASLIELANLLGDGDLPLRGEDKFSWTSTAELTAAVLQVRPDPLRLHLLELMHDPKQWRWTPEYMIKAGFKPEIAEVQCQAQAVTERYRLIRGASYTLKTIVSGEKLFPATVFIERCPPDDEGREIAQYAGDELAWPLIGVDLRYIKKCEVCGKFFFAARINSDACDPKTCGKTLQKRRERHQASQKAKRKKAKKKS